VQGKRFVRLGLFAVAAVGGVTEARAQAGDCIPITTVPAVIDVPGLYCLVSDLASSSPIADAIRIEANNVVLDLKGHRLGGLSAGPATQATGIYVFQRQNVTIRNGTVRGFLVGILVQDFPPYSASMGHVIEDIRADHNLADGIVVQGQGSVVRRNRVLATGGGTCCGPNLTTHGIRVEGIGQLVADNDVVDVRASGTGHSYGIFFGHGSDLFALDNRISRAEHGIYFDSATGKYRGTLTSTVAVPYGTLTGTGVIDAGGNN
jgi:hypothetical protein